MLILEDITSLRNHIAIAIEGHLGSERRQMDTMIDALTIGQFFMLLMNKLKLVSKFLGNHKGHLSVYFSFSLPLLGYCFFSI